MGAAAFSQFAASASAGDAARSGESGGSNCAAEARSMTSTFKPIASAREEISPANRRAASRAAEYPHGPGLFRQRGRQLPERDAQFARHQIRIDAPLPASFSIAASSDRSTTMPPPASHQQIEALVAQHQGQRSLAGILFRKIHRGHAGEKVTGLSCAAFNTFSSVSRLIAGNRQQCGVFFAVRELVTGIDDKQILGAGRKTAFGLDLQKTGRRRLRAGPAASPAASAASRSGMLNAQRRSRMPAWSRWFRISRPTSSGSPLKGESASAALTLCWTRSEPLPAQHHRLKLAAAERQPQHRRRPLFF